MTTQHPPVPHWRRAGEWSGLPERLKNWLTEQNSLTLRIVAHSQQFAVRRCFEGEGRSSADEAQALALTTANQAVWCREVILLADQQPFVFARSVCALASVEGAWAMIKTLHNRPLGAVLFTDSAIERAPLEIATIEPQHFLWQSAQKNLQHANHLQTLSANSSTQWARRAIFWQDNAPLLVHELFLPHPLLD